MRVNLGLARVEGDREEPLAAAQPRDLQATVDVPAGETKTVTLRTVLPRERVRLWTLDRPVLHVARATLATPPPLWPPPSDTLASTFGIRRFEVKDTQLLLNGQPIRLGGGNRASDHPRFGLIEPREVVEPDLRLMKAAGMELQRMIHYALPTTLLDAADRLGVLIIAEAGNWQLEPPQMDDEAMRADYRNQMREMVERDWNHPSVIAWSVGNEYPSATPAGVRWTKDMAAFVRTVDASRPITFASYRADRPDVKQPEDEGSHYVDFISTNLYGKPADIGARLDVIHKRWPNKPVFISEFGVRADKVKDEVVRETYFHETIGQLRTRPYVAGASVWTFNDYRSRFPDTNANGYRPWGLIDPDRQPRGAYRVVKEEFATLRLTSASLTPGSLTPIAESWTGARHRTRRPGSARRFPVARGDGMTLRLRRATADDAVLASTRVPDLSPGQRITRARRLAGVGSPLVRACVLARGRASHAMWSTSCVPMAVSCAALRSRRLQLLGRFRSERRSECHASLSACSTSAVEHHGLSAVCSWPSDSRIDQAWSGALRHAAGRSRRIPIACGSSQRDSVFQIERPDKQVIAPAHAISGLQLVAADGRGGDIVATDDAKVKGEHAGGRRAHGGRSHRPRDDRRRRRAIQRRGRARELPVLTRSSSARAASHPPSASAIMPGSGARQPS